MKLFVFDTETHLIAPGLQFPPCVCVSVYEAAPMYVPGNGPLPALEGGRLLLPSAGLAAVRAALLDPTVTLVGHNIAFDFGVLCALDATLTPLVFDAYEAGRINDTQIREQLIQLALGNFDSGFGSKKMGSFSMLSILKARFNMDISADKSDDAWRLRYAELDGIPLADWPEEACSYPVRDVTQTYAMWCAQADDTHSGVVDDAGAVTNEAAQVAADWALKLMSAWGVRTNRTKVDALAVKLEENSRSVREALTHPSVGLFRPNGTKNTKLLASIVEAAYAAAGETPPLTAGGKTSTAKEVLLAAPTAGQPTVWVSMPDEDTGVRSEQQAPVLLALASISADEHNMTTYIEPLRSGADVPITARFNVLVESGRTSCGKPINLQNLPKYGGYRECVESRPGTVFIQADYSGIELVALSQHILDSGWHSEMAQALIDGRDLHTALAAAEFLNITYEEAQTRRKSKDPQMGIMRQAAKQVNFGFPGGMGPDKFVATVKKQISKADFKAIFGDTHDEAVAKAAEYKQTWLRRWPEMRRFFADVSTKVEAGGGEFTLVQPRSGRLRGACGYSDGCNSYFQGLTADGMKAALFYCSMECYTGYSPFWTRAEHAKPSPLFGSRPVIEVHDEFIFEAAEDTAAEACERMCAVMVQGMALYLTDVPVKVEPSMFRVWSKSADEVRDANGRLMVWEPK